MAHQWILRPRFSFQCKNGWQTANGLRKTANGLRKVALTTLVLLAWQISATGIAVGQSTIGEVERKSPGTAASWNSRNTMRISIRIPAPNAGLPLSVAVTLPLELQPNSIRLFAADTRQLVPAKLDWKMPNGRITFRSTSSAHYYLYFDTGNQGETELGPTPAMVGAGDRITYGANGVIGRLAVGLQPRLAALDADADGDIDLVITCPDRPYNGIYLFTNIGTQKEPLYSEALWLGPAKKELTAADVNGDGHTDLLTSGGYFSNFPANRLSRFVPLLLDRPYWIGRDDHWTAADYDHDGKIDILTGVSDWRDYGWDDAFDASGRWLRGPLHGYVYWHRNIGSNQEPRYAPPIQLEAGGQPIDQYGSPAPNFVDWFGRGVLDLVAGSFVDTVTIYRNLGTRSAPRYAEGELLQAGGATLRMPLCMIQPRAVAWHASQPGGDRRASLLIAEEDGAVALVENVAAYGQTPKLLAPRYLQQVNPFLKSGALSRPVLVDWNGDGTLDILSGNTAGQLQFFANVGTADQPIFQDRGFLQAGGQEIRRLAGPNGSIQGPAEAKWGYSNPSIADWDGDGDLDILVNDIWGLIHWYQNIGTRNQPRLAPLQEILVEWPNGGPGPYPEWNWWRPKGKQLVTQWRTTPKVVDWNRDGLPDLVMLNHQGYLSLFPRQKQADGSLVLLPPQRIFLLESGRFLNLANGRAGSSGRRKIELADWDRDGDLDLITDSDEGPIWYENIGSHEKPVMKQRGTLVHAKLAGHNPTPAVTDWNGDGQLDLFIGAEDGFFYYYDGRYLAHLRQQNGGR